MIKIFHVIGTGYIIGEVDESEHKGDSVMLNYPAQISASQDQQGGTRIQMVPLIAPFLKHHRELTEKFRLKNSLVMLSDEAPDEFVKTYKGYVVNIKTQLSGIIQPGAGGVVIPMGGGADK